MLKLRHLLHDKHRALEILSRWDYNPDQPDLMEKFRISANAVYSFTNNGVRHFLRFAHEEEKSFVHINAELEYLGYLSANGYPCLRTMLSRQGNEIEVIETEAGRYHAVVFLGVPGKALSNQPITPEILFGWGKHMGRMHHLSSKYTPHALKRVDYVGQLKWMSDVLSTFPGEELARKELNILSGWLSRLPKTTENFGLIHYDFETDNVFYDEATKQFSIIDFDDTVYHWFVTDIVTALASYEGDDPELAEQQFIAGYRTEHPLEDEWVSLRPGFKRYQNLYGYVRVIRSLSDKDFGVEPEWMVGLRQHLANFAAKRSEYFGKPL